MNMNPEDLVRLARPERPEYQYDEKGGNVIRPVPFSVLGLSGTAAIPMRPGDPGYEQKITCPPRPYAR